MIDTSVQTLISLFNLQSANAGWEGVGKGMRRSREGVRKGSGESGRGKKGGGKESGRGW